MKYFGLPLPVLIVLFFTACTPTKVAEWRGPNRSGVYNETNLLKQWPENGPELTWENENIGNGYVSPTITDDAIYITGEIDSLAHLYKFDFEGTKIWDIVYDKEWVRSYRGARSNPTIVGDLIYVGSGMGNLFCINSKTGETIWSKKFADDFNGTYPYFGHSEAPVVDGNKVFWTPGGEICNVVALDRFTGELIWSNEGLKERSGYNNPKIITVKEHKILVTFSAYHLLGIDAEKGELLWSHEQTNTTPETRNFGIGDTHANTVLFEDGAIYYAAGDGNGGVKLQLSDDGSLITEVWNNKDFDSYMGGIVKSGNKLYGCGTAKPRLVCADAVSGELTDSLKIGQGTLISADDMLYYYNVRGKVYLIDIAGEKMNIVSDFKIDKGTNEHFAHPVIHKGVLYIRHGNALMAYDIKNRKV